MISQKKMQNIVEHKNLGKTLIQDSALCSVPNTNSKRLINIESFITSNAVDYFNNTNTAMDPSSKLSEMSL